MAVDKNKVIAEATKFLADALALSEELADQKAEIWVSLYLGQAQRAAGPTGAAALANRHEQNCLKGEQDNQVIHQVAGRDAQESSELGHDHSHAPRTLRTRFCLSPRKAERICVEKCLGV